MRIPTKEKPVKTGGRNRVDTSGYQGADARNELRKGRKQAQRLVCFFDAKRIDAVDPLRGYVRALARTSAEQPRWRKIVEHADSLADRLEMSREEFYETALIEYIEKLENARISRELSEAYKNIDQEEDLAYLNELVSHYDPRLADQQLVEVRQGEVYHVDFPEAKDLPENWGSAPKEPHPVVVIQHDSRILPNLNTVVCCLLTTNLDLGEIGGNVTLSEDEANLPEDISVVNISQIIALDKRFLGYRYGEVHAITLHRILKEVRLLLEGVKVFRD